MNMRVEVLEESLKSDGFVGYKGDRFSVPVEVGKAWCKEGWAKDLNGVFTTLERVPGARAINIADSIIKTAGDK